MHMGDVDPGEALRTRTNSKVEYARVHLNELAELPRLSGSVFERAHQESFLFHLFGVRDALLAELNHYYNAGCEPDRISPGKLRDALKKLGVTSAELVELRQLDEASSSWYALAKRMRDHSAHVQGVRRRYYLGGDDDGDVRLIDPAGGGTEPVGPHVLVQFRQWFGEMTAFVSRSRASSRSTTGR